MCLTMARDLGSLGIRVLAIAPSLFATGLTEGHPRRVRQRADQGRGVPEAARQARGVRQAALAIVDNPMLNGQCIRLDAGQRFAPK